MFSFYILIASPIDFQGMLDINDIFYFCFFLFVNYVVGLTFLLCN